jgi:hypothetical protein
MPTPPGYDADPRPLYRGAPGPYPGARGSDPVMRAQMHGRDPVTPQGYSVTRGQMRRRPSPPGPLPSWWGSLTARGGVCIVLGGAALGALITVLAGTGPGPALGVSLVAATLAAALTIQPRAVYRIIPVPALAYVVTATVAGLIGDRVAGTSHTALAVSAAQWTASGFLPMTAATMLAIAVTAIRWFIQSRILLRSGGTGADDVQPGRPHGRAARTARCRSTSVSSRSRTASIVPWRTSARTSSAVAPASA